MQRKQQNFPDSRQPVNQSYLDYHVDVNQRADFNVIDDAKPGLSGPNRFTSSFSSRDMRVKGWS